MPESVEICIAGSLRVHLVREGDLQKVTTDHILRNDIAEFELEDLTFGHKTLGDDEFVDAMGCVATRALGENAIGSSKKKLLPETLVWQSTPPYQVIICSSDIHGHQPASSYFSSLHRFILAGAHSTEERNGYIAAFFVDT